MPKNRGLQLLRNWARAFLLPRPLLGGAFLPKYVRDYIEFRRMSREPVLFMDSHPCLLDATVDTPFDPHYFYQGAWLSRMVTRKRLNYHVDVGSSVLTVSVLSGLVKTLFVDYRPLRADLPGLVSVGGDILRLPFNDNTIDSLSTLHVIEHVGLGRYGDPLDPDGSVKAARELTRILAYEGNFYLSVPVGRERVCFNAHRVFHPKHVVEMFGGLQLEKFSFVDDKGRFIADCDPDDAVNQEYACGMYSFIKKKSE